MRFFRIYWSVAGGHTHTRWFSGGSPNAAMGLLGELTMVNDEWEALRTLLQHSTVECVECHASAEARLADIAPDLLAQLKLAVKACPCSVRERDSGHMVDCFAPGALDLIARAEGAQR